MSEQILKALMQLFALVVKQDGGVQKDEAEYVKNFLDQQLRSNEVPLYFQLFHEHTGSNDPSEEGQKLTSVKDSVRILSICKKINKTLTQKQKIVVLLRLIELIKVNNNFSDQRKDIIKTVGQVFRIDQKEYESTLLYVVNQKAGEIDIPNVLTIDDQSTSYKEGKHLKIEHLDTHLFILRVPSVDIYFLKYTGEEDLFLNGMALNNTRIYLFAKGSVIKLPKGKPIYYSDVTSQFLSLEQKNHISFEVEHISKTYPNGYTALNKISFAEKHGKLIGILGASGSGKTTLLNVLSGSEKPSEGSVTLNGIDIHRQEKDLAGSIGVIPQDDLLIEELTVYQNLFYSAQLCFNDKTDEQLDQIVCEALSNLGLLDQKDLKVGNVLEKTLSGGQRKRLNIALELIREPSILFADEPTSGLSSRDSENVMDLLRELTLKGQLIFVVIHQPSSEIFKMFDRIIILDQGGKQIYHGNPIEAVTYFKRMDAQINSNVGACKTCGNVNPELIFNIIETRVVDEFGNYTTKRKVEPAEWEKKFKDTAQPPLIPHIDQPPSKNLRVPHWFKQVMVYLQRDMMSKVTNLQYLWITLLEAPILGFTLSFIIRYSSDPESNTYFYRDNENIPIYIFMALIVVLFFGLTISAEEIFKDRKLLKRERFLHLSWSAYLSSKILLLAVISLFQSLTFLLIANNVLEVRGMFLDYWIILFSVSLFANLLGLNISASFNSAITIYVIIPVLMIPMMILSGAIFNFSKMNKYVGSIDKVPLVAEFMVTKWAYEALMVNQFTMNQYERIFYEFDKKASNADIERVYILPKILDELERVHKEYLIERKIEDAFPSYQLLLREIKREMSYVPNIKFEYYDLLKQGRYDYRLYNQIKEYIKSLDTHYAKQFEGAFDLKNKAKSYLINHYGIEAFVKLKDAHQNQAISDQLKNVFERKKIITYNGKIIPQIDPVYRQPQAENFLDFRSHFFAPMKHFGGNLYSTFWFNLTIIWLMSIILYMTLYWSILKRILAYFEKRLRPSVQGK